MPVGIGPLTCDTLSQVLGINSSAHLFNESYLGL
jgi:hypothetical protein